MEEEAAPNVETFNTPVAAPAADGGGGGCDVRGSEAASCCSGCCCGFMAEADDVDRDFCVVGFVPADVVGCGARNIAARFFCCCWLVCIVIKATKQGFVNHQRVTKIVHQWSQGLHACVIYALATKGGEKVSDEGGGVLNEVHQHSEEIAAPFSANHDKSVTIRVACISFIMPTSRLTSHRITSAKLTHALVR